MLIPKSDMLEFCYTVQDAITRIVNHIENNTEFKPFEKRELLNQIYQKTFGIQMEDILGHANQNHKLQIKRGDSNANETYIGMPGEITMDMDTKTIRIHDGETVGGTALARATDIVGDYVVDTQLPTAENNHTWYRKYKSGWIEMGGRYVNEGNTSGFRTISLPVTMSNAYYNINTTCYSPYTNATSSSHAYVMEKSAAVYNQTTNSFQVFCQEEDSKTLVYWTVCGI